MLGLLSMLSLLLASACTATRDTDMSNPINVVKTKHEARLLAMPGVVSVGIGQDRNANPVIIIGVERPAPLSLPEELDGYRVETHVIGPVQAH
jgi:hypothetical protein